jgi:hypothetical protein
LGKAATDCVFILLGIEHACNIVFIQVFIQKTDPC